jgi:hypothetical protein
MAQATAPILDSTRLPIPDVRFHGEFWRVTGPSLDIGLPNSFCRSGRERASFIFCLDSLWAKAQS